MAPANWRPTLGFSTRLTAVTRITSAYQSSDPAITAVEARGEATMAETRIYNEAQSLDEYERLCEGKIADLVPHQLEFPNEEDEEYVPTPGGRPIGKYPNAVYHREGLFSTVYRASALEDVGYFQPEAKSKVVALKVTSPSTMEQPHNSIREAKILSIATSDCVVPLLDHFRVDGGHFVLVFPFMRYDLNDLLQSKKLSSSQTKTCLRDLFSALSFIHGKNIIHRDIKPSNILLKSLDGPAYLSDFGIAWAPNTTGSEAEDSKITDVGTTSYRPPELLFGNKHYGCSLDLWAAGCTVAELLDAEHTTLFHSGELGSDLALIQSMFKKLGTPNLDVWPEAAGFPDWGKVQFYEYPARDWITLLPNVSESGRDLVSKLVRYESDARVTAAEALKHPYFEA